MKVGDRWLFVKRSTAGAKLEYAWVVTSVSPTGITGTENGQPLALTLDLNIIESPQEKNSDDRFLRLSARGRQPLELRQRLRA